MEDFKKYKLMIIGRHCESLLIAVFYSLFTKNCVTNAIAIRHIKTTTCHIKVILIIVIIYL
jgi:hypothetical protein